MFWRNKKIKCDHHWHHLVDTNISNNYGGVIDFDGGCWIFCHKCKTEELVYKEKWERIKKRQEILEQLNSKSE